MDLFLRSLNSSFLYHGQSLSAPISFPREPAMLSLDELERPQSSSSRSDAPLHTVAVPYEHSCGIVNTECPVCSSAFAPSMPIRAWPCSHATCDDCGKRWVDAQGMCATCPLCRTEPELCSHLSALPAARVVMVSTHSRSAPFPDSFMVVHRMLRPQLSTMNP